jgi:hypothetical protein
VFTLHGPNAGTVFLIAVGGVVLLGAIIWGMRRYQEQASINQLKDMSAEFRQFSDTTAALHAKLIATTFLQDVEADDLDDAYDHMSPAFRTGVDRKAFEDKVRKDGLVGALAPPGEVEPSSLDAQADSPEVLPFVFHRHTAAGRIISVKVNVEKWSARWQVKDWQVRDLGPIKAEMRQGSD